MLAVLAVLLPSPLLVNGAWAAPPALQLSAEFSAQETASRELGGALLSWKLWVSDASGDVDTSVDIAALAPSLSVQVDRGRVSGVQLEALTGAPHMARLQLRYWPTSDGGAGEFSVSLGGWLSAARGPAVDVTAERLLVVVMGGRVGHGERSTVKLAVHAVAGDATCHLRAATLPCVVEVDGSYRVRVSQKVTSTGTTPSFHGGIVGETTLIGGAYGTLSVELTAVLHDQDALHGSVELTVEQVGGAALAPAQVQLLVRGSGGDLDVNKDGRTDSLDAELVLMDKLRRAPVAAVEGLWDVTGDGAVGADDGLLIGRYIVYTAHRAGLQPESVVLGLPYLNAKEVLLRLRAAVREVGDLGGPMLGAGLQVSVLPRRLSVDRSLGRLSGMDPDGGALSYHLAAGAEEGLFRVDSESGRLWALAGAEFAGDSYALALELRDSAGNRTERILQLSVNHLPVVSGDWDCVMEETASFHFCGPLSVSDHEGGTVSLEVTGVAPPLRAGSVRMALYPHVAGAAQQWGLTLLDVALDYESSTRHEVTVRATDALGDHFDWVGELRVLDVGGAPPRYVGDLEFELLEGGAPTRILGGGASAGRIVALDADGIELGLSHYQLWSVDSVLGSAAFSLVPDAANPASVTLRIEGPLYYLASSLHRVVGRITAAQGDYVDVQWLIRVLDDDDQPPRYTGLQEISITEGRRWIAGLAAEDTQGNALGWRHFSLSVEESVLGAEGFTVAPWGGDQFTPYLQASRVLYYAESALHRLVLRVDGDGIAGGDDYVQTTLTLRVLDRPGPFYTGWTELVAKNSRWLGGLGAEDAGGTALSWEHFSVSVEDSVLAADGFTIVPWSVDQFTPYLRASQVLSYAESSLHRLVLRVDDIVGGGGDYVLVPLTLRVLSDDSVPPSYTGQTELSVLEGARLVDGLSATDQYGVALDYTRFALQVENSVLGANGFAVVAAPSDGFTPVLEASRVLDYEESSLHRLVLRVSDARGAYHEQALLLRVLDRPGPFYTGWTELAAKNSRWLSGLSAEGEDGTALSWEHFSVSVEDSVLGADGFTIVRWSGDQFTPYLRASQVLSYAESSLHRLVLRVDDIAGGGGGHVLVPLTLRVLPDDSVPPSYTGWTEHSALEGVRAVGGLGATDQYGVALGWTHFEVRVEDSVFGAEGFTIVPWSQDQFTPYLRALRVLDYEESSLHRLVLRVSDARGAYREQELLLRVLDRPGAVVYTGLTEISVDEGARWIGGLSAQDAAGAAVGYTHFSVVAEDSVLAADGFTIVRWSGDQFTPYLKASPALDYEESSQHRLVLTVTDAQGEPTKVSLLLLVRDRPDPVYTGWTEYSVLEGAGQSTAVVGGLSAVDAWPASLDYTHFSVAVEDSVLGAGAFSVVPVSTADQTAALQIAGRLDYEESSLHRLVLTVTDRWGETAEQRLLLRVLDRPGAVVYTGLTEISVDEGARWIGGLSAQDAAGAAVGYTHFSVVAEDSVLAADGFTIVRWSGDQFTPYLKASPALDYEESSQHRLVLTVTDAQGEPTKVSLLLLVRDRPDPVYTGWTEYSVLEGAGQSTAVVGGLSAVDAWPASLDYTHFSVAVEDSVLGAGAFSVVPVSTADQTAALQIAGRLDYEESSLHRLVLTVTDRWGETAEQRLLLRVLDRPGAVVYTGLTEISVDEGARWIGGLSAQDAAGAAVGYTHFSVVAEDSVLAADGFTIVRWSGDQFTPYLKASPALDYEESSQHRLVLTVTDAQGEPTKVSLLLLVRDRPDPVYTGWTEYSVLEGAGQSTAVVGGLSAVDAWPASLDYTHFSVAVEDSVLGAGAFSVVPVSTADQTAALQIAGRLDYEESSLHRLVLTVTDRWGETAEQRLLLRVLDDGHALPVYSGPTSCAFEERDGESAVRRCGPLLAWDAGGDELSWSLGSVESALPATAFSIEQQGESHWLRIEGELDYEQWREHRVTLRVANSSEVVETELLITVKDSPYSEFHTMRQSVYLPAASDITGLLARYEVKRAPLRWELMVAELTRGGQTFHFRIDRQGGIWTDTTLTASQQQLLRGAELSLRLVYEDAVLEGTLAFVGSFSLNPCASHSPYMVSAAFDQMSRAEKRQCWMRAWMPEALDVRRSALDHAERAAILADLQSGLSYAKEHYELVWSAEFNDYDEEAETVIEYLRRIGLLPAWYEERYGDRHALIEQLYPTAWTRALDVRDGELWLGVARRPPRYSALPCTSTQTAGCSHIAATLASEVEFKYGYFEVQVADTLPAMEAPIVYGSDTPASGLVLHARYPAVVGADVRAYWLAEGAAGSTAQRSVPNSTAMVGMPVFMFPNTAREQLELQGTEVDLFENHETTIYTAGGSGGGLQFLVNHLGGLDAVGRADAVALGDSWSWPIAGATRVYGQKWGINDNDPATKKSYKMGYEITPAGYKFFFNGKFINNGSNQFHPNPIGVECNQYPHSVNRNPYITCGIPHSPLLLRLNMPAAHLHTGLDPIYMKIDHIRLFKPKGVKAGYADLTPVYH